MYSIRNVSISEDMYSIRHVSISEDMYSRTEVGIIEIKDIKNIYCNDFRSSVFLQSIQTLKKLKEHGFHQSILNSCE